MNTAEEQDSKLRGAGAGQRHRVRLVQLIIGWDVLLFSEARGPFQGSTYVQSESEVMGESKSDQLCQQPPVLEGVPNV